MANLAKQEKNIVDHVANKVTAYAQEGALVLPENYSPENAMKSAWLTLQEVKDRNGKLALDVCTKDSIANALLDMAIQGLSPAKKQCYFIVYGKQLQLQRAYFGTVKTTKALSVVDDINAQIIYVGDTIEDGIKSIVKHEQDFMNIDPSKIKGAYCIIKLADGSHYTEIMNMNQIKQAWKQSKTKPVNADGTLNQSSVHAKFTDQMALKTVINRACKMFANTSDDSDLLIESFNRTTENEFENDKQSETLADIEADSIEVIEEPEVIEADAIQEPSEPATDEEQVELDF